MLIKKNFFISLNIGGRRGKLSLQYVLEFGTCAYQEPALGFCVQPALHFYEVTASFVPTSNTCINAITSQDQP